MLSEFQLLKITVAGGLFCIAVEFVTDYVAKQFGFLHLNDLIQK